MICHTKGAILLYSTLSINVIRSLSQEPENTTKLQCVCVCVCSILYMCLFVRTCTLFSSQLKHVRKITFRLDHEIHSLLISYWLSNSHANTKNMQQELLCVVMKQFYSMVVQCISVLQSIHIPSPKIGKLIVLTSDQGGL